MYKKKGVLTISLVSTTVLKVHEVIFDDTMPKCHVMLVNTTLVIVNIVAVLVLVYDRFQAFRGSFRVSDLLVLVLIWAGAWPVALFMVNSRKSFLLRPVWILAAVLLGFTLPAIFTFFV